MKNILQTIVNRGGKPYLIGGCVRDSILGAESKDIDIEVFNIKVDDLIDILSQFGKVDCVGKSFGVIKLSTDEGDFDFSLPRRENKVGVSHKDFEVILDDTLTIEEAASRRDFTFNAISKDVEGNIVDPFGGVKDLESGILRHTSDKFGEDVLRALRAFQFCGRFNLLADISTIKICRELKNEFSSISKERIWTEFEKWAMKSQNHKLGLDFLVMSHWIDCFPELRNILGVPQEYIFHPEGWELFVKPINSSLTSSTITKNIYNWRSFWKCISSSITSNTFRETVHGTFGTSSFNNIFEMGCFFTATDTGLFSLNFSSTFVPTIITESESFVFNIGKTTRTTDKVNRVVFKIPIPSMNTIVSSAVDDLQIIDRIIGPVSIYMMDMFSGFKLSTQESLHNKSMKPNSTGFSGIDFTVFADIVDFSFNIIENEIVFSIGFCYNKEFQDLISSYFVNINVSYDTTHQLEIKCGDVLDHTGYVVNAMNDICVRENISGDRKLILIFAALCHDLGKAETTIFRKGRISAPKHDFVGGPLSRSFLESIKCPNFIIDRVIPLVENHMCHLNGVSDKSVRKLSERLGKATIEDLVLLIEADHSGRPPKEKKCPEAAIELLNIARKLGVNFKKPERIVAGKDLIHVVPQGKDMGDLLSWLYSKQLEGKFFDLEGGLKLVSHHHLFKKYQTVLNRLA